MSNVPHAPLRAGLGVGRHFGEWWGSGIQRGYGRPAGVKHFSLFNVSKWGPEGSSVRPECCSVVPTLAIGGWNLVASALDMLRHAGSIAAPGFLRPEGIVIFHCASSQMFKVTLECDEAPKGGTHGRALICT